MSNRPSLRTFLVASAFALASAATVAPSQACEVTTFISTPITLNTPVECVLVTSEGPIEGDITNNVQIGNAGGDFAVSVIATTVTGRFFNNGLIIQDGPTPSNVSFATYDGANIAGGIVNNGTIRSTTGIGMSLGILLGFQTPSPVTQTGAIDNFGTIDGGLAGFDGIAGSFLNRLWNHDGATISGGNFGIVTEATFALWQGGILNDGFIVGTNGNGINLGQFNTVPLTFTGGITNSATGTIAGGGASALVVVNTQFSGGVANRGLISGFSHGIVLDGSQFSGGINNFASGQILGNLGGGILINGGAFSGGIDNAGRISSATEKGIVVTNTVTSFTGDIVNRAGAQILAITGGIEMRAQNWSGNLSNAGTIQSNTGDGVLINNSTGTWGGSIVNDGIIQGGVGPDVLGQAALHVDLAQWNGGILNRGLINSGATGVLAGVDVWNGNLDNRGLILGAAGVAIGSNTFTGNILNAAGATMRGNLFGLGICHADCQEDFEQTGVNFIGSLINSGDISKRDVTLDGGQPLGALTIFANTWTGDIVNEATGVIRAPTLAVPTFAVTMTKQNSFLGEGVDPLPVATFNGNFINRGEIRATVDLRVANWTGNFDNSGSMTAFFPGSPALKFTGGINGFFLNSGAITGPVALDLSGTTSTATYRQTGATARANGNILLSTTAATTLDFRGGQLTGNVIGAGGDDIFQVNAGAAGFAYLQGALSNLASLSVNSGAAIFGSSAVGVNGSGVTMTNVGALSVAPGAVLYLDDNTSISATSLNLTPTSTLAAFLTTNTAQHGSIALSSGGTLAGAFVAHLDPLSFAGTTGTSFQYNGLISGPTTGTFSSVTIAGPPSIFNITPIYGSFSVLITRTPFDEFADEGSPNQENVGSAIEDIYQQGTSDPDLLNLINTIASDPDAAGDIYDAIAGSTQAETSFTALKADDPWKQSVAQRVDAARSTGCTVTGDTWCRTRYAQATAAPVQTDAGEDPDAFAWLDSGLRDVGATSIWGRVVGIWGESDGGVSSPAADHRTYGLVAGADHVVDGTLLVGLAAQYVRTKSDFEGSQNTSGVESIQAGAYFSYGAETYLNGNVSAIATHASTKRIFSVGAIDYVASVRYPATSVTAALDLGKIFEIGDGYRLEPHAGVNFVAQFADAYAEHGAGGLGLIVDPEDIYSLRTLIGARASRVFDLGDRKMVPELRLEWRHEYLDRNTTFLAAFQGAPDATFLVECEPVARDVAVIGGALTLPLAGRITGYLDAEGAFSEDTRSATISLGARATW